jgi:hypothetical protein
MKTDRKIDYYFDKTPPQVLLKNGCVCSVIFSDEGQYRTGIGQLNILYNSNIKFTREKIDNDYYTEKYKIDLINQYQDGKLIFEIYDIVGNSKVDSIMMKGFTISNIKNETDTIRFQEFKCDTMTLNNTGHFIQNFRAYFSNNIIFSVPPSQDELIINSGNKNNLIYCKYSKQLGFIVDSLILVDECYRTIKIPIEVQVEPNIYEGESGCGVKIRLITSNKYLYIINSEIITSKFTGNIQVFNIIGNLVYSKSYNKESLEENIDLNTGIYFIIITDQSGNQRYEKILITY